ncbi:MAG: hypothetical protein N2482_03540 [Patescibacteria group bacterium]|nr:hypothetical protein [Patescibacteria group bacterium]
MENNQKNKKPSFSEDFYKGVLIGFVVFLLILLAFFLGLKIGRRDFSPKAIPPMFHPLMKPPKEGFIPKKLRGHGVSGTVDSVSKESFIVKSRWGELMTILVDKKTQYRVDGKKGGFSDIKKGKNVFIIGEPDEKEAAIKALIIRIF